MQTTTVKLPKHFNEIQDFYYRIHHLTASLIEKTMSDCDIVRRFDEDGGATMDGPIPSWWYLHLQKESAGYFIRKSTFELIYMAVVQSTGNHHCSGAILQHPCVFNRIFSKNELRFMFQTRWYFVRLGHERRARLRELKSDKRHVSHTLCLRRAAMHLYSKLWISYRKWWILC